MAPVPYLFFKGTCEEAMHRYAAVFGSPEPQVMYARDAPEGETSSLPNAVMHAALQVGDGWLYASDYSKAEPMAGSSIALTFPNVDESRRIFDALAEGGEVEMPLTATSWSPGFGSLTDRFGTRWMIDTTAQAMPAGAPAEAGAA
ncbi:MAG TPA: VOC family protein [Rubellimicrobium sp.]|nr:VOC family protein [Rubellimicrobium sp.]